MLGHARHHSTNNISNIHHNCTFLQIQHHIHKQHTQQEAISPQMIDHSPPFSPRAAHMTEEHIEAVKETLAAGFLEKNEIWSAYGLRKKDILKFFDRVIRSHMAAEQRICAGSCLNIVAINNERVIGCKLHYDLQTYLRMQGDQKEGSIQLFVTLEKAGRELTKDLDFSHYPKGRTAFINFGGYHPDSNLSNLLKVILFTQVNQRLKQSGFDWVIGRLSNARAMGLYKKFGAKVLNQISFEVKGTTFQLFFFQMNLHSEAFCRWEANLERMIELERNNIKHSKL